MKQTRIRIAIVVFVSLINVWLLHLYQYGNGLHNAGVHMMYGVLLLSIVVLPKYRFVPLYFLTVTHIGLDTLALRAVPTEALFDTSAQLLLTWFIWIMLRDRERMSRQLTDIIDAADVGTWQWNLVTGDVLINERWASMLGYRKAELEPVTIHTWESLAHPEDLVRSDQMVEDVRFGHSDHYVMDVRMRHRDGHYVWIQDRGNVSKRDIVGTPLEMSGTHTDITARKELEIKEAYYHELMSRIIDNMNSGIAVHDKDMNYVFVSRKYKEQYGVTDDITGKHHYEVFPDLPEKWREVHRKTLQGETFHKDRDPYEHADGSIDVTRWKSMPWYDENNEIAGLIIYTEVINDLIEKEQQLEEYGRQMFVQKEEIEATLLAIGDAVISTDADGYIKAFNAIATELTGYDQAAVVGKAFNDIFRIYNEVTNEPLPSPVDHVIEHQETMHLENHTVLVTATGERRVIEDSAAPIFNKDGDMTGVILVFRDVTDRKKKQQEIEYLSLHDYLTGLYNRRFFAQELARIDKAEHYPLGIVMIDLNGLKILNDAYGHEAGDEALKGIAGMLMDVFGKRATVARIGGDEFAVLMSNASADEMDAFASRIAQQVADVHIRRIPLSVAVGYTIRDDGLTPIYETIKTAEDMMYRLKLVEGASARNGTIRAILNTLTDKFDVERRHSERVSSLCAAIAKSLGLRKNEITEVALSGMMHDIGKITIPDHILTKPDRLTKEEFAVLREHTANGYKILRAADAYSHFAEDALYHHEHFDGGGYPEGLSGEDIPLFARIIGVADAFEAMTSDRPYRKAMNVDDAIEELKHYRGTQFDPVIVDVLVNSVLPNWDE